MGEQMSVLQINARQRDVSLYISLLWSLGSVPISRVMNMFRSHESEKWLLLCRLLESWRLASVNNEMAWERGSKIISSGKSKCGKYYKWYCIDNNDKLSRGRVIREDQCIVRVVFLMKGVKDDIIVMDEYVKSKNNDKKKLVKKYLFKDLFEIDMKGGKDVMKIRYELIKKIGKYKFINESCKGIVIEKTKLHDLKRLGTWIEWLRESWSSRIRKLPKKTSPVYKDKVNEEKEGKEEKEVKEEKEEKVVDGKKIVDERKVCKEEKECKNEKIEKRDYEADRKE